MCVVDGGEGRGGVCVVEGGEERGGEGSVL